MIALVIVVLDEGLDLLFEITGQEVVLQQRAVLERLVPALDLALGLRMEGSSPRKPTSTMRILSSAEKCRRVLRRMSFTTCSAGNLDLEDLDFIFVPSSLRRSPNPP